MHKILRLNEVKERTARSRSSIYSDIQKGNFPAPIPIGERAVGWLCSDIDEWIEQRILAGRQNGGGNA